MAFYLRGAVRQSADLRLLTGAVEYVAVDRLLRGGDFGDALGNVFVTQVERPLATGTLQRRLVWHQDTER
jgi:hypothetical protein